MRTYESPSEVLDRVVAEVTMWKMKLVGKVLTWSLNVAVLLEVKLEDGSVWFLEKNEVLW